MDKKAIALLMNDIHVGKDNIPEFHKNWNEAIDICHKHGILDIFLGGDLWQSRSSQNLDTLLAVREAFKKIERNGLFLTIAAGNHDCVDQESVWSYNHIFEGYQNIELVDDYGVFDVAEQVDLIMMRYYPENGGFMDHFNNLKDGLAELEGNKLQILYIHQGIRGGLGKATDDELPADIFEDFDNVLVGHYHDRKVIPGTNIEYIGSSRQHNFGEDEEKGYTILYSDGTYEFIKNEVNTRYKTIEVKAVTNKLLKELGEIKEDGRYRIKLRISCKSSDASNIDKSKLLEAGASKIEFVTEQTEIRLSEAQSIDKKFDKHGIKEEYQDFCNDRSLDSELGLRYLDKIK